MIGWKTLLSTKWKLSLPSWLSEEIVHLVHIFKWFEIAHNFILDIYDSGQKMEVNGQEISFNKFRDMNLAAGVTIIIGGIFGLACAVMCLLQMLYGPQKLCS